MIKCNCCGRENSNYSIYCEGCGSLLSTVSDSTDVKTDVGEDFSSTNEPSSEPVTSSSEYASSQETYQSGDNIPPEYTYDPTPATPSGMEFDVVSIVGFIFSVLSIFCCGFTAPIPLIICIIGLVTTSGTGKKGRGLAVAGLIISIILIIVAILILIFGNGNTYTYYSSTGRHH